MTAVMTTDKSHPGQTKKESARIFARQGIALSTLLTLLYVGARLWRLTAACRWFDEIFSVHAARHGWGELWQFAAADLIHPPLFYALLKVWLAVGGESLVWLRLFPALTSIAALIPFFLLARELKLNANARNFALLLLASSGFLIKYAQEVRMYSLLFLLALFSFYFFVRLIKRKEFSYRAFLPLFGVNLLLVYTHYFGWCVVLLEGVALWLWHERRMALKFMLSVATLLILYTPWLFALSGAAHEGQGLAQNIGWVARPGFAQIAEYFTTLNTPFYFRQSSANALFHPFSLVLSLIIFGALLSLFTWRRCRALTMEKIDRTDKTAPPLFTRYLLLFAFAPVALTFLPSWLLPHSVWGTRHLIIVVAPYAILAATAFVELRLIWLKLALGILLGGWLLLNGAVLLLTRPPEFIWCAWEELPEQQANGDSRFAPGNTTPVSVYAFEDLVAYHLWFAGTTGQTRPLRITVVKDFADIPEDKAYFLPRRFDEITTTREFPPSNINKFWIAFRAARWDETRAPLKQAAEAGYRVTEVRNITAQGQTAFLVRLEK